MTINYIKEKYMEHAPKWEIEGYTTTPVRDEHYMPENADYVDREERIDTPMVLACLGASFAVAVILAWAVWFFVAGV